VYLFTSLSLKWIIEGRGGKGSEERGGRAAKEKAFF